ncbi:hypothetical protein AWZ03_010756 [Drosophila navojoa]|uniref:Uncharacterized protein n=1 Tax=Drosophila navojoa TaxID=7232 RepID=A0A484B1U6_DRONA|nr:involucrin [Drosophila navojoa]TDG42847.1 hypothetical protein AWZ03_010756 [Drosophila navojoa]
MNFGALARSLSHSLRVSLGSKKRLSKAPTENDVFEVSTPSVSNSSDSKEEEQLKREHLNQTVDQLNERRQPYRETVELILDKVSELEHTLYEDQQQEFKLRMALERQTERIHELHFSLDTEKQRNERLVQLLRGVDSDSCSESEPESQLLSGIRIDSKGELYGSISPILMQQRYDELHSSYRQAHRLLAKKDKTIKMLRCDLEVLRGKYDSICSDYRNEHRRLNALYTRYMHLQQKKKQQVFILKETLGYASDCILYAQQTIDGCSRGFPIDPQNLHNFNQNFEFFMRSLRSCCCRRRLLELQQEQGVQLEQLQQEQERQQEEEQEQELSNQETKTSLQSQLEQPKQKRRSHRKREKH